MKTENRVQTSLFEISKRNENSWWVTRCTVGDDGHPLPYGRMVFFSRTHEEAQAWVAKVRERASTALPSIG